MEINVSDYLSGSEMRQIVVDVFREQVKSHFRDENNFKRILTNTCYDMVWAKVDEAASQTIAEYLPAKVKAVVEDINHFHLFKKPDAWSRETNAGYQILERVMLANEPLIRDKVVESINSAPKKWVRMIGEDVFKGIVERAVTGGK